MLSKCQIIFLSHTVEVISERPVRISSVLHRKDGIGVGLMAFSCCGHYFAVQVNCMPAVVWIWSIADMKLISAVIHSQKVSGMLNILQQIFIVSMTMV